MLGGNLLLVLLFQDGVQREFRKLWNAIYNSAFHLGSLVKNAVVVKNIWSAVVVNSEQKIKNTDVWHTPFTISRLYFNLSIYYTDIAKRTEIAQSKFWIIFFCILSFWQSELYLIGIFHNDTRFWIVVAYIIFKP